ncbi:MAG: galactokinase [Desulfobacterales bacterium]|nr:galactokinase [Desulfobacterales bacterium]
MNLTNLLLKNEIKVSVPCRVDLGGTLDISTFFLPLNFLFPSSFNIAINMRTHVTLSAFKEDHVKISSKGFESAQFQAFKAPFNHPMGLMFAIADYFNVDGVHIHIESSSPPRSALGGSSAAAVAITAAFLTAKDMFINAGKNVQKFKKINAEKVAWIAHYIESSVAGVPCGMQDQLAAAFGGVNQWFWKLGTNGQPAFIQKPILKEDKNINKLNDRILVAYCGIPHVSSQVNKKWVNQFICGENRDKFEKIVKLTDGFARALQDHDFSLAGNYMNQETQIRLEMTPEVLDPVGKKLFNKALQLDAGARFTGAGGGGCVWAIGNKENIKELKNEFNELLKNEKEAKVLDTTVDSEGIRVY